MAQIDGVLNEPFTLNAPELVMPIPVGDLVTPFEAVLLGGVSEIAPSRFPVPPVAAAFLIDVDSEMALGALSPQGVIYSALSVQGSYLEPTIGQIWPR